LAERESVDALPSECEYHACNYIGNTSQCTYCKHYFCPTHLQPKPPSTVHLSTASYEELQNWNREDAHPCIAYVDDYKQKQEEERNAAKESFDRMKYGSHSRAGNSYEPPKDEERGEEDRPTGATHRHHIGMNLHPVHIKKLAEALITR